MITGLSCEEKYSECMNHPCLNNGTCIDYNGFMCQCPEGYSGEGKQIFRLNCTLAMFKLFLSIFFSPQAITVRLTLPCATIQYAKMAENAWRDQVTLSTADAPKVVVEFSDIDVINLIERKKVVSDSRKRFPCELPKNILLFSALVILEISQEIFRNNISHNKICLYIYKMFLDHENKNFRFLQCTNLSYCVKISGYIPLSFYQAHIEFWESKVSMEIKINFIGAN